MRQDRSDPNRYDSTCAPQHNVCALSHITLVRDELLSRAQLHDKQQLIFDSVSQHHVNTQQVTRCLSKVRSDVRKRVNLVETR